MTPEKLKDFATKTLDSHKAEDIVTIDLKGKSSLTDYMIIATGKSSRQVTAMAKKLREAFGDKGLTVRTEGLDNGDWAVVDAGDVIIHIFRPEVRDFYEPEKIWGVDYSAVDYTVFMSAS